MHACPTCNYSREGLSPSTPCPECGADLADRTKRPKPPSNLVNATKFSIGFCVLTLAIVLSLPLHPTLSHALEVTLITILNPLLTLALGATTATLGIWLGDFSAKYLPTIATLIGLLTTALSIFILIQWF